MYERKPLCVRTPTPLGEKNHKGYRSELAKVARRPAGQHISLHRPKECAASVVPRAAFSSTHPTHPAGTPEPGAGRVRHARMRSLILATALLLLALAGGPAAVLLLLAVPLEEGRVSEDNHRRQQARNHGHRIVYPGPGRTQRMRHKLSAHERVSYEIQKYKYRENTRTETFVRSQPHTPWGEEPQRLPFQTVDRRAQTRRPTHLSPPAERMRGVRSATGRIFEHPPNPPC